MKSQKKSLEKGGGAASPGEPCKPILNSQTCNSLNYRSGFNPKARHLKN